MNKNKFLYFIYGEIVSTNVELPFLKQITDKEEYTIELTVTYGKVIGDSYIIREQDGYRISFTESAIYYVYETQNRISCIASSFEKFFSTVFNIPFSVFFALRNEILFHCCALKKNDIVFCLTGNKGIGKSTLTSILGNKGFTILGDDTLRLKNDLLVYSAHNLIKITDETKNNVDTNYEIKDYKNISGKHYGVFKDFFDTYRLNTVIQLTREEKIVRMKTVDNIFLKKNIFFKNIVGINFFDKYLLDIVCDSLIYQSLNYTILTLPDNLDLLICKSDEIKRKIEEILK